MGIVALVAAPSLSSAVDLGVALWTTSELPQADAQRTLEENLMQEEEDLEDDIKGYAMYPVLSIGLSYKF